MKKTTKLLTWVLAAAFFVSLMSVTALAGDTVATSGETAEESIGVTDDAARFGVQVQKRWVYIYNTTDLNMGVFVTNFGKEDAEIALSLVDSDDAVIETWERTIPAGTPLIILQFFA